MSHQDISLSLKDTNTLKGFGIILMLLHHLFWQQNGLFDDINILGYDLVNEIGKWSKVCVTLFVFLSGYGITIGVLKSGGVLSYKAFYLKRYKKLYLNYWFVWIIFVPLSVFVFNYTFSDIYQTHVTIKFVLDILGISWLFCVLNYNPTWWFHTCIVSLYALYPVFYKILDRDPLLLFLMSLVLSFLPYPFLYAIHFNVIAFVLGMYFAKSTKSGNPSNSGLGYRTIIVVVTLVLCFLRNYNQYPNLMDVIITISLIHLYRIVPILKVISNPIAYIGKHSLNIYLFHTFIYYYWFQDFVYLSRNPIVIFFTLLAICIPISVTLEWVKKYTIYKL